MLDTSKSRMTFELPNDDEEENTNAVVTKSRLLDMTVTGQHGAKLYKPFFLLKKQVRNRILNLAQINSMQTVKLVKEHFRENQQDIIMQKFHGKYDQEQYDYLCEFFKSEEDEISKFILQKPDTPEARKYERYVE